MEFDSLDRNALRTTCGLYDDCGYWSDLTTSASSSSTLELNRCSSNGRGDCGGANPHSHGLSRSASASTFSQYSASPLRRATPNRKRMIMDDADKAIYNSLGSSSSPVGKLTYSELGLWKGWTKRGILWKTGPNPSWYTPWRKRYFVLKGNFLYYFAPRREMKEAPVLGAIYLKNAIIKKESMALAKKVLKISPPVPRRMGGRDAGDDSSEFHLKFKSEADRREWYEILQSVSFENEFPAEKKALINASMEYVTSYNSSSKSHK